MGTLVEQTIKSFFQGVSRQPDSFRNPGQVEDGQNVQFSVETGGFSKRYPLWHVKRLTGVTGSQGFHTIDRDPNEKYLVTLKSGAIRVFTPTGVEKTVTVIGAAGTYLTGAPEDYTFVSVLDYTFVLNREKTVALAASPVSPAQANKAVVQVFYSVSGIYKITVDGFEAQFSATTHSTLVIADNLKTNLNTALPAGYTVTQDSTFLFIEKTDGSAFTIKCSDPYSDTGLKLTYLKVRQSADLPARAPSGLVVRVGTDDASQYYVKSEQLNAGDNNVRWVETVAPGSKLQFDASTMPHVLVRTGTGDFEFKQSTWNERTVGTDKTAPDPEFVGTKIRDVIFQRNRLAFLADETVIFSTAGDYFNFWPEKTTIVVDDAPFGSTSPANKVTALQWAVPFRKAVFASADNAQFEINGELLTPKKVNIELATSYTVSNRCRPVPIGDSLYFTATNGSESVILEYLYDDSSVSNVAVDATKHVKGFVPATVTAMTADSITGNLFCAVDGDTSSIYVYSFFWNGDEKVQQAWGRWSPGGIVRGISFMSGYLYALVERDADTYIERASFGNVGFTNYSFPPQLDRLVELTGTYNSGTGRTTWTLPYPAPTGIKGVSSKLFATVSTRMYPLSLTIDSTFVVSTVGNWGGQPCIFGVEYDSFVELSKLYPRESDGAAIITGRTQVRYMTLLYENSGYFEASVTPLARDARTHKFTGRVLGDVNNQPSLTPITSGAFRFRVGTRADTVRIRFSNASYLPFTITSAAWTGFFNELTRQE